MKLFLSILSAGYTDGFLSCVFITPFYSIHEEQWESYFRTLTLLRVAISVHASSKRRGKMCGPRSGRRPHLRPFHLELETRDGCGQRLASPVVMSLLPSLVLSVKGFKKSNIEFLTLQPKATDPIPSI